MSSTAESRTEECFREMGLPVPDLSFLRKHPSPSRRWGREETLYSPAVLVDNWYEERRAYVRLCPKFTGCSIMKTDYVPKCPDPHPKRDLEQGEGLWLLRNTEDYCDYLRNYTTTYDLMHNHEVRRAGVIPKPRRFWKLSQDAAWAPERDNALSFGNLTQIGYRQGPQLPVLPNDWDLYAHTNKTTTNDAFFPPPKYPDHYVHCRKTPPRAIRRENEGMMLLTSASEPCCCCGGEGNCPCACHSMNRTKCAGSKCPSSQIPRNLPRFPVKLPASMTKENPGLQTVYSTDSPWPYRALKRKENCKPERRPFLDCCAKDPFKRPDACTDYAGDVGRE